MQKLFLIDGNNLIHALAELRELPFDSAVERVVEMALAISSLEGARVYVVLDFASPGEEKERVYSEDVKVIYAGKGRADECIEGLVHRLIEEFQIFVVSADYEVQKVVFSKGGYRFTPREFQKMAEELEEKREKFSQRITIEDMLDEETRKKLERIRRGDYNSKS